MTEGALTALGGVEEYVDPTQASDFAPLVDTGASVATGEVESKDIAIAMARIAWETKGEDLLMLDVTDQVRRFAVLNFRID